MHPGQHLRRDRRPPISASTSRSTSASWARCRSATRATSRRTFSRSSAATITASRPRTSNPAGCRRTRASTSSRPRSASCCEPIFDRPLSEISLGRVLMQLFRASRRFNVEIQPQLVLLQKTLLNVEGLGRAARPRARPVDHREAVPRALDGRADRPARRCERRLISRSAVHRRGAARAAAALPSVAARTAGGVGRRRCASSPPRSAPAMRCWSSCCCYSRSGSCCSSCTRCSLPGRI